jgi:hypothetical protein
MTTIAFHIAYHISFNFLLSWWFYFVAVLERIYFSRTIVLEMFYSVVVGVVAGYSQI